MCDPVSLGIAAVAIAAGGAYASYDQQEKQAQYQQELNDYNNELSAINNANNMNSLSYNQNQTRDATTDKAWGDDLEARRAEARARVAAGESGVAGNTVDSILREIKFNNGLSNVNLNQNLEASYMEGTAKRQGVWNSYLNEKVNRPPVIGGNEAVLALGIANAGLSGYNTYSDAKFKQDQAAAKK